MTHILHLETSTKVCSVALSNQGVLVDYITETSESFMHSERLNVLIQEILDRNSWTFSDLQAIAVSCGPGSYTGLRIGVSTAKGLCFALAIPLIAVDALLSLAQFCKESDISIPINALFLSMIDARRMEAFTALYDSNMYAVKPIAADIFDENYLQEIDSNIPLYLVGDAQEKCKSLWSHRGNFHFTEIQADARGQIRVAFEKFQNQMFEDLVYFEPYYLKDFQIGAKKAY